MALVDVGLTDRVAKSGLRDPEIGRDLGDRLLLQPGELNGTPVELRRVWSGHLGLLSETIVASESLSGLVGQAPSGRVPQFALMSPMAVKGCWRRLPMVRPSQPSVSAWTRHLGRSPLWES